MELYPRGEKSYPGNFGKILGVAYRLFHIILDRSAKTTSRLDLRAFIQDACGLGVYATMSDQRSTMGP